MRNLSIASRKAASWVVNATSKARPWLRQQPFAVKSTIKHHIYMNYCMAPAVLQAALPRGKYKISVPSTSWFRVHSDVTSSSAKLSTSATKKRPSTHSSVGNHILPSMSNTQKRFIRLQIEFAFGSGRRKREHSHILNRKRECANSCQSHLPSR